MKKKERKIDAFRIKHILKFCMVFLQLIKRLLDMLYMLYCYFIIRFHGNECKAFKPVKKQKKAIIVGNGPSLNKSIRKEYGINCNYDYYMVNHSVETDYFEFVKPHNYVIADPFYFENDVHNDRIISMIKAFNEKLSWKLRLYIPYSAKDSCFDKTIRQNKYINVYYFSSVVVNTERFVKDVKYSLWNMNKICPLSQNVLNTAISIAISKKYSEIYLVGADSSWLHMLQVDQNTNDLYSEHKHYYKTDRFLIAKYDERKSNIVDEIDCIKKAFESYQVLKEYANYNGCNLFNASDFSMIDCLERKKIDLGRKRNEI